MQKTMAQMLQSLMNGTKPGDGKGGAGGRGAGMGGLGSDGSTMQGMMAANMPIFGPSRLEFGEAALAYGEYRPGGGKTRGRGVQKIENTLNTVKSLQGSESKLSSDAVPLKYKQAVKKFFSDQESNDTTE